MHGWDGAFRGDDSYLTLKNLEISCALQASGHSRVSSSHLSSWARPGFVGPGGSQEESIGLEQGISTGGYWAMSEIEVVWLLPATVG